MLDDDTAALDAAIAALEGQRATLGDEVLELAVAPLRARLAALRRPAGLQRRRVTVLFADVVGSTAMAGSLDAEDTLDVLSTALRKMAALVESHHGRVLRYTGDGVKAAFGMDEAREDDPERAVRAGLAILQAGREQAQAALQAHGIADFAVRVGVHTGDVALGAGVEADNTAMGVAVNIAARMEQSAPPGALRISRETFNHVRGLFDVEPQPPLQVKGVDGAMSTYLVRAALERSVAIVERGLQGLSTPMVGRSAELERLRQTVVLARQTRQLQALTLIGDAGLGKSRLLREWIAELQHCQVMLLRSQPDGMLRPWGLLRSLLALQFGVADTDSAVVARGKVEQGLSHWFEERGPDQAIRQAQLIGQLSGLDYTDSPHVRGLDPRTLRDLALAALRGYLQALAARSDALPVLVVEDLHWCDDSSLDLLQHLLAHAAELPLVLEMTGRPTLLTRRPDWGTADTLVQLQPLLAEQRDELVLALLQRLPDVPARLMTLVTSQAEGNPYYMEELVRRLIDDGAITIEGSAWKLQSDRLDALRLPGTLVGLLQARLDALPADQRRAARLASVIGHVFWDEALQAVDARAPQALPDLQRAAYVRTSESSDFEGTAQRRFDHHLLHQVTYDTLLKEERRRGHGAAARWLAERTPGRGAEFLGMTGEHAERAGETALAIDSFEQAGRMAQARFANAAAESYFRRALALLGETDPARSIDLLIYVERVADAVGDRDKQEAAHAQSAALLERHPDDGRLSELWCAMARLAERRGDTATADQLARRSVELAEACAAADTAAMAHAQLAWGHISRYDHVAAGRHLDSGLSWAGRIEDATLRAETEAQLLTLSGMVSMDLSQLDDASRTLEAVLARGVALGKPRLQLGAMASMANVAQFRARWGDVVIAAERMRALAEAIGSPRDISSALMHLAQAAAALGDGAAALRWHQACLDLQRTIGDRRMQAITLRFLAEVHLSQGDTRTAMDCCDASLALHQSLDEPLQAGEAMAIAATCELRLGQPAAALVRVNAALDQLQLQELATYPAKETLELRWLSYQVLAALDDARGAPLLDQLQVDVLARAGEVTETADQDRLIQATPVYRAIVAAHQRRGEVAASP